MLLYVDENQVGLIKNKVTRRNAMIKCAYL